MALSLSSSLSVTKNPGKPASGITCLVSAYANTENWIFWCIDRRRLTTKPIDFKCLIMVGSRILTLWVGKWPWIPRQLFPNDLGLRQAALRMSYVLASRGQIILTLVLIRERLPVTLHQFDQSLIIGLGELAKPWFRAYHERYKKRTVMCSSASVAEEDNGHVGCTD